MKRLLAFCLAVVSFLTTAQTTILPAGVLTSPNLVYSTVNPWQDTTKPSPGTWSGFTVTQNAGGGLSGGQQPGYNIEQGKFLFGYAQGTVGYNYAISEILRNSNMTWLGYNYSWEYVNQDYFRGTLSANVNFVSPNGTVLHNKNWTLGQTTEGWRTISGTETFTTPALISNISSFNLSFTGRDDRFWAGYWGPQVRNPSMRINYTLDQCYANPLSSPDCAGHQQALLDQQCTANPLYSTSCSGYAAAYQTQQCTSNPLYSPQCAGYQTAFFNQQCTANPLYATTCTGYQQAYFNQQCSLNGLYDRTCPNYSTAYAQKQLLDQQAAASKPTTTSAAVVTEQQTATVQSNPVTAAISDPVVNTVVSTPSTTNATSTTSVTSVVATPTTTTSPTSTTSQATTVASTPQQPTAQQQQEQRVEAKKTDTAVARVERSSGGNAANARVAATEQAKELAKRAGEAATMEAQVATQSLQVGLMSFVPGFSAYQNAMVPDTLGNAVARQYHKPPVDNRNVQRRLNGANELRWREMVDSQYKQ